MIIDEEHFYSLDLGPGEEPAEIDGVYYVFACPYRSGVSEEGIFIGKASSVDEAITLCTDAGHAVILRTNGGEIFQYDNGDAPNIFGYERDGHGAIGITALIDAACEDEEDGEDEEDEAA